MAYDREAIKEHYNQHVTEGVSTHEALRQRREGPAAPLKKFHNDIKRRLIYRFGYRAEALLDYACGRGGDIHKWWTAEIKYVKGLDLSPKEIEEAQRRYGELRAKEEGVFEADFQQIDNLGLELVIEDQQYDLATCMFALHYFFDAEKHIMTMLDTVARNLKPGGYFIATVPDGKRIKAHLLKSGGLVEKPQLVLKQKWEGKDTPFGSAFVMEIPDTVVEGHEGVSEGSHEYLVFEKVLLGVAAKSGLYPVTDYDDPSLTQLFEESEGAVKHFNPSYPQTTDPSLTLASKLYMAVVFQKVGSAAEAKAPPKRPPPLQSGPRRQQQQPRGPRRSPPREERFAAAEQANGAAAAAASGGQSAPAWRPQQQQHQQQDRGQGKGFNRNENWQLPYHAVVLPPTQWPCAYYNVKDPNFLEHRATKYNRFKIVPPPMPMSAGPVPWDPEINNFRRQLLPDGRVIDSYYDELQYHEELQQAASGPAVQQQRQHGGPTPPAAAGRGPAGAPQQQNRQQQQQYPGPPAQQQQPQASQPAGSPNASAKAAAAAENVEATEAGGKGSRGRGRARARGKGRAAAAAEGEDAAAAGDAPTPARRARGGRGSRGARGGAAAGAKRARDNQADADSTATGAAADGAEGEAAPDAVAAAADDAPAAKRPASAAKAAGGGAAPRFLKGPVPDPLGYKEKVVVELPQEVVEQLAELAPQYAEPLI